VPADLYSASLHPYLGLPDINYPFHDRDIIVTKFQLLVAQWRGHGIGPAAFVGDMAY